MAFTACSGYKRQKRHLMKYRMQYKAGRLLREEGYDQKEDRSRFRALFLSCCVRAAVSHAHLPLLSEKKNRKHGLVVLHSVAMLSRSIEVYVVLDRVMIKG